jgi:hypothetical protein
VETDAQAGEAPGDLHGFGHGRFIHHEAGLRDKARTVRTLDGGIDLRAAPKVISGDDEVFQFSGGAGRLTAQR